MLKWFEKRWCGSLPCVGLGVGTTVPSDQYYFQCTTISSVCCTRTNISGTSQYIFASRTFLCLFIRSSRLSASTSLANEILGIFIKYLLEYIAPDALQELHFKLSDLLKRVIKRLEHYF